MLCFGHLQTRVSGNAETVGKLVFTRVDVCVHAVAAAQSLSDLPKMGGDGV